jgi:hypothetical protein
MDSNNSDSILQVPSTPPQMTLLERVQEAIDAAANLTCVHPIPPPMETIGTSDRIACPSCIVKYHIAMIKTVQLGLEYRGGVFGSKQHVLSDDFGMTHKNWTKLWTAAKIESYDDIAILEEIQDQHPEQAEEWGIPQALRDWEQAQDDLARVAGYNYAEEEDVEEIIVESETPPSSPPKNITRHFQNVDLFDPFTDVETEVTPEPGADVTASTFTSDPSTEEDEPTNPISSARRSALKGNRSTTLPRIRATFSEQTAIISENSHPADPANQKEHSAYTTAEAARSSTSFYRPSPLYQAAAWASPDGWEKDDTSFSGKSWDRYARMNRSTDSMAASTAQSIESKAIPESTSDPAMAAALADAMSESPEVEQGVEDAVPNPRDGGQKATVKREYKKPQNTGMEFIEQSER